MKKYILLLIITFPILSYAQLKIHTSSEFESEISKINVQLLDVRTTNEFNNAYINNALQADWYNQEQFKERVKHLDKSKPVAIYCQTGIRSAKAAQFLRNQGFKEIYDLKGGLTAWLIANKATVGQQKIAQITNEPYRQMINSVGYTLVDFGAKWCAPCKKIEPIINTYYQENIDKFSFVKIDGGEQVNILKTLNIEAFPTFIVYHNGKEVWRKTGIVTTEELAKQLSINP